MSSFEFGLIELMVLVKWFYEIVSFRQKARGLLKGGGNMWTRAT